MFTFTVDKVLNPYIPRSIVPRLPPFIGRWLGQHKPCPIPDYILWLDILIGSFCSILLIEGLFMHVPIFENHHAPIIIASYGASAVLAFNCNGVPLAQPRNILFGHFISALIGVCLQKLFALSEPGREHFYVGGALAVGLSSVAMLITNTVHPPSGASALIPVVDAEIRKMGWWYLPAHLVSSVLMIAVACITNNVLRKYPTHWWTAYTKPEPEPIQDEEKRVTPSDTEKTQTAEACAGDSADVLTNHIVITGEDLILPSGVGFTEEEMGWLKVLQSKVTATSH